MRDLMKTATMVKALFGGLGLTALCVPFIVQQTPPGALRTLRIAFLAPVCILLLQAGIAWTPIDGGREWFRRPLAKSDCLRLLLVSVALAAVGAVAVDPLLSQVFPDYFPDSPTELVLGLPWMSLFQPLVFVVGCYAFAIRLSRRPAIAVLCVILAHQTVALTHVRSDVDVLLRAATVLVSGAYALILAVCYRRYGFLGPVAITYAAHCRHIFRFM